MIIAWYVGFYAPWVRDLDSGSLSLRGVFGHCDVWGVTDEGTWLFLDPEARGAKVRVTHLHDDVQRQLAFRNLLRAGMVELGREGSGDRVGAKSGRAPHRAGRRQIAGQSLQRLLRRGGEQLAGERPAGRGVGRGGPLPSGYTWRPEQWVARRGCSGSPPRRRGC